MPTPWRWLEATDAERAQCRDVETVLAMPRQAAAPPNRLRSVHRVALGAQVCYLKQFDGTQWKNRVRNWTTSPRANDDAEREARVTTALRRAGVGTPRPLAVARDGAGRAFYLCAELPGRTLREQLERGALTNSRARAAARFCGELLRRGFHLPDLSAAHLYDPGDGGPWTVLDLHNGSVRPPARPPARLLRRVLRHFWRSVRDLHPAPEPALRFSVRLLRAAGTDAATRRTVLEQLPPIATARRYEAAGKAGAYAERNPRRHAREMTLLQQVWPGRDGETVLDCPSGAGRLLPFLREHGHRAIWGDGAAAMLREARGRQPQPPPALQTDATRLALADGCVDGAIAFRFLHHLPPPEMRTAVDELARVARRFVVVSFFHPVSAHAWSRRVQDLVARRAPRRHAVTLGRLQQWFAARGLQLAAHRAERRFLRDFWVAAFVRD